jgi:mediator of replication checkpoint protein 1
MLEEDDEQPDSVPDSQVASTDAKESSNEATPAIAAVNPLKRKAPQEQEQSGDGKENVPPMSHRRRLDGGSSKRPATLAEIREAVSFLIDEPLVPDSQISGSESGSDHEEDYGDDQEQTRRVRQEFSSTTILGNARSCVVNRLSVVRTDEEATESGPLAFHSAASNSLSGFKVPSLLRRATTNLSNTSSTASSGTTTPAPSADNGVRRGGSKKSNIHYQAREAERKKIVDASERRRKEQVKRSVIGKGRQSVLGAFRSKGLGFE